MSSYTYNTNSVIKSRIYIYILLLLFTTFIVWAYISKIDTSIRARGQVIASANTQILQAPDNGIIENLKVKEGDSVEKNQAIIYLEKSKANAAYNDIKTKVAILKIKLIRLNAELYGTKLSFDKSLYFYKKFINNQKKLLKRRKKSINETLSTLKQSLYLLQQELDMYKPLVDSGDISKLEIIKLINKITEVKGKITTERNKYYQSVQEDMTKIQEELATQEQNLLDKKQTLNHTVIKSPVKGVVKKVNYNTTGAVVRQGDEIIEILPIESDLIIEAKIPPIDMYNLKRGLLASIKLDAYDYSIFGSMTGSVEYISPDTLEENGDSNHKVFYKVKIRIKEEEFKSKINDKIKIDPGMTVSIDIKTGQRTVLTYLFKPIIKTLDQSMSER
jgi:adhesin transport system membrane fusion protein